MAIKNNYESYFTNVTSEDKDLKKFCSKYNATIRESTLRFPKPYKPYDQFVPSSSYSQYTYEMSTETGVDITMPTSSVRNLLDAEDELQWHRSQAKSYGQIIQQYREDERARDNNPVVQKAWQKYLMLLELTRK